MINRTIRTILRNLPGSRKYIKETISKFDATQELVAINRFKDNYDMNYGSSMIQGSEIYGSVNIIKKNLEHFYYKSSSHEEIRQKLEKVLSRFTVRCPVEASPTEADKEEHTLSFLQWDSETKKLGCVKAKYSLDESTCETVQHPLNVSSSQHVEIFGIDVLFRRVDKEFHIPAHNYKLKYEVSVETEDPKLEAMTRLILACEDSFLEFNWAKENETFFILKVATPNDLTNIFTRKCTFFLNKEESNCYINGFFKSSENDGKFMEYRPTFHDGESVEGVITEYMHWREQTNIAVYGYLA